MVKIGDFGLCIDEDEFSAMICGTVDYMSPEVIMNGVYTEICDIYSLGVVFYKMLHGKYPFFG